MYLTYDEYRSAGGQLDEGGFEKASPTAEIYFDRATMSRLRDAELIRRIRERGEWYAVTLALTWMIDGMDDVSRVYGEQLRGRGVSSFSNGRTTISFEGGDGSDNSSLSSLYDRVYAVLPLELATAWTGGSYVC